MIAAFKNVPNNGRENVYVTCPSGMNLLYCGNQNSHSITNEQRRSTIPFPVGGKPGCMCYDRDSVICNAWCTAFPIKGYEVIGRNNIRRGKVESRCPIGKKVLGCNQRIPENAIVDKLPQYYPSSDDTCTCKYDSGGTCIASCASDIAQHEIVVGSGLNSITVKCQKAGNRVLGCGIQSFSYEPHLTTRVSGPTSCECYNRGGANCYAICGQL